jgi:hypothetical protein
VARATSSVNVKLKQWTKPLATPSGLLLMPWSRRRIGVELQQYQMAYGHELHPKKSQID